MVKKLLLFVLSCSIVINGFAATGKKSKKKTNKLTVKKQEQSETKPAIHIPKDIVFNVAEFLIDSPKDLAALMQTNKEFQAGVKQLIKSNVIFKKHPEQIINLLQFKAHTSLLPANLDDTCKMLGIHDSNNLIKKLIPFIVDLEKAQEKTSTFYHDALQKKLQNKSWLQRLLARVNLCKRINFFSKKKTKKIPLALQNVKHFKQTIIQEIQKKLLYDATIKHAYKHAHEDTFQAWFNQQRDNDEQKALFGIACRAFFELQADDHGQTCFENCPENIFKMMLRFASKGNLNNGVFNVKEKLDLKKGKLNASRIVADRGIQFCENIIDTATTLYGKHIKKLYLEDNHLTTIPDIIGMPNLQKLSLHGNYLTTLPDFTNIPNLEILNLAYNQIASLPDFTNLPNLKKIILTVNQLTTVPNFTNLPNLQDLDLSANRITTVPDLQNMPSLRYLDVALNHLTSVPNFTNLPNLQILDLSDCNLTAVPDFTSLPCLRRIMLWNNTFAQNPDFTHLQKNCEILFERTFVPLAIA